ncbi:NADH-quinone oxidoreductase subunit M [Cohnella lubricantis]|uniref:NADH-quinone oxidoreductase subunit M n=1 Tax=Cohnella lubricantis TaxID=2163172 RepID=A0A841TDN0_9BACL|nr:NADH-quinone oxidoreductase subunit M [Cohnella lubricantis]MBB6679553.1 NADH-quinone oxidoreductase subunit M [Cohnella lubricantis]MBP2117827.1 NADH-quinone oxidoreductase subunit M [Cohnella lubricantis]
MFANVPVLSLIIWLPLLGSLVVLLLPGRSGGAIRWAGISFTFVSMVLAFGLYASYLPLAGGGEFAEHGSWLSVPLNTEVMQDTSVTSYRLAFDYSLGVDGISMPLVLLTGIVASMASLASVHIFKRQKTYFSLFLLLQTGMYGVFLARDVIWFFIFFELTLIPMFFLIGIWGYYGREKAANRFLVYNGLGSAVMLLAFLILIATLGFASVQTDGGIELTFSGSYDTMLANLADPNAAAHQAGAWLLSDNLQWAAFILLLVAFGIKLPIFPFHTWMLKVHAEAPPPVVMIHSGILLKMGVYGLIRFAAFLLPAQLHSWSAVLAVLGVINILYGAVLACAQKEFKLVLAYSSISHMGIVLLGIASLNETGFEGAVYQAVSHGLISALLFLIVGSLHERTGTTRIDELGGLARAVPFTAGILLTAGLASLGLPGLSGFIGEFLSFLGLFSTMKALTAIGTIGVLLAAVYMLRSVLAMTYGPLPEKLAGLKEARFIETLPMVVLTAFIVLLGIYPSLLTDLMQHGFDGLLRELQTGVGG